MTIFVLCPESKAELIYPTTALYRKDEWGMKKKRSFADYLDIVGIDPIRIKNH